MNNSQIRYEIFLKAAELEPVMVMPEDPLFLPDE